VAEWLTPAQLAALLLQNGETDKNSERRAWIAEGWYVDPFVQAEEVLRRLWKRVSTGAQSCVGSVAAGVIQRLKRRYAFVVANSHTALLVDRVWCTSRTPCVLMSPPA
jgi:hypothetical protein